MTLDASQSLRLRAIAAAAKRQAKGSRALIVALLVMATVFVVLFTYSWSYYQLPWEDRFDAPLHRELRASGRIGHLYGNIGTVLILGNLLYLVRRRLVHVAWLGSMKAWMDWHVFSGIVGAGFVLLHSTLTMRTWPAIVSSIALAVVVVTGLFGRYLYRLVPRIADGSQQATEELAASVDQAVMEIRELGPGAAEAADRVESRVDAEVEASASATSGLGAIIRAMRVMWRLRGLRALARSVAREHGATPASAIEIGRSAAWIGRMLTRVELIDTLARAAAWWRGLHRNLVMVMLLTASLHVSIAVYLGFAI